MEYGHHAGDKTCLVMLTKPEEEANHEQASATFKTFGYDGTHRLTRSRRQGRRLRRQA